ncbi:YIP1 family protein [Candidatus Gracilibacteria bacterium]|nr:YIP1 family protein [Candidatus Gracilibacteria bacterium]
MYHIFFQPNDTANVLKKHSTKEFSLLLFVASVLTAVSMTLLMRMMPSAMSMPLYNAMPFFASVSVLQLFLVSVVGVFVSNLVRTAVLHFVMRMFAEKGALVDAFKIVTVIAYLSAVYLLMILILSAVPFAGICLAAMASFFAFVIIVAVFLRGVVAVYKTDLLTTCVALGVLAAAMMLAMHVAFFGMFASGKFQLPPKGKLSPPTAEAGAGQGTYGFGMMRGWQY